MIDVCRAALSSAAAACAVFFASAAGAEPSEPSRDECLTAHRNAQELKQSSKFLEAQEHLLVCSSASCPGAVISDCGDWIAELERATPSMIFEVRLNGKAALDATLFVDGRPVSDRIHAVKVNPGRHVVRVELAPFEPREEVIVLPEGQRMRLISVDFESKPSKEPAAPAKASLPPPPPPAPPRRVERPTPGAVYALLGLGVVGLGGFGVLSYLGKSEQDELEQRCAPDCAEEDLEEMRRWYLIGDVSAGVGGAALLGAAVVYLARPTREVEAGSSRLSFGVGALPGASRPGLGISASSAW